MAKRIIYTEGELINGLVYLRDAPKRKEREGVFKCYCGNEFTTRFTRVKNGDTKSCGCQGRKSATDKRITHSMFGTRMYSIYHAMRQRCYYPKAINYKYYGEKGVTICDEWLNSFECFQDWAINNGYDESLSIDRWPDKKGNYEPSNCRWATRVQQQNNRNDRENTITGEKYISFGNDRYNLIKRVNGKVKYFGSSKDIDEVIDLKNELVKNNWNEIIKRNEDTSNNVEEPERDEYNA